jgi:hypothetical protein
MPPASLIISEAYAGLQAQALGLAEAAGLTPDLHVLAPRAPWRFVPARLWPAPLAAVGLNGATPGLVIGCGGMAAAVGAALRRDGRHVVQVQHPRMDPKRFDLVIANPHDRLAGPNVLIARTALHRATPARLREAAATWAPRFAHLPRPLVAVLVGGSNGRYRLGRAEASGLGGQLATMMRRDGVGVALTPSRRTGEAARAALAQVLAPTGAWLWDGTGENPYFGLLALADAIVVTADSVSMVSEAVATSAPVLLAPLPGRSRRIARFTGSLIAEGRVQPFQGRFETWTVAPLDDTPAVAAEMRHRLGL